VARSRLAQLRAKKHWSQQHAATLLQVDVITLSRWERGKTTPHGYNLEQLCNVYECIEEELGFGEVDMTVSTSPPTPLITKFTASDLTVRIMAPVFAEHCSSAKVQAKVNHILEEFDTMEVDSITRRDALQRLVALSLFPAAITELSSAAVTLNRYAASIVACQELGRGKDVADLSLAFEGATTILGRLRPIIQHSSRHRKDATTLAAQAARLQEVLAGHLEGPDASIRYAKQAVAYGKESGNVQEYLMTLEALAWAYESEFRYGKHALQTMEQAVALLQEEYRAKVPLYLHSQIYSTYAVMQAKNGLSSTTALQQAAKYAFADQEYALLIDDPMYSLTVNEAEALSHHGNYDTSQASLMQLVDTTTLLAKRPLSERGHVRVLSNMMQVSLKIKKKDLEQSIRLWKATMHGVWVLKSERRFEEAMLAYQVMNVLWGDDKRVQDLRPMTIHW
jgi:transcriptional regulator with XRE-family HTH domain